MTRGPEIVTASVVITAQEHDPTILHPSFLLAQKIVPEGREHDPPVCTGTVSTVRYKNGVSILVDKAKLQVMDENLSEDPTRSEVASIASKYVACLEHVRYTGVGVNLTGFLAHPDADGYLINRFLKGGQWSSADMPLQSLGLRFAYELSPGVVRFSCDSGAVQRQGEEQPRPGILIQANYHTDISPERTASEDARAAINRFAERTKHFVDAAQRIFGV